MESEEFTIGLRISADDITQLVFAANAVVETALRTSVADSTLRQEIMALARVLPSEELGEGEETSLETMQAATARIAELEAKLAASQNRWYAPLQWREQEAQLRARAETAEANANTLSEVQQYQATRLADLGDKLNAVKVKLKEQSEHYATSRAANLQLATAILGHTDYLPTLDELLAKAKEGCSAIQELTRLRKLLAVQEQEPNGDRSDAVRDAGQHASAQEGDQLK